MEILGVSCTPGPGVESDMGLYEFCTDSDVPVRLHDIAFQGLHHQPVPPRLTLRFAYDDPMWTPRKADSDVSRSASDIGQIRTRLR